MKMGLEKGGQGWAGSPGALCSVHIVMCELLGLLLGFDRTLLGVAWVSLHQGSALGAGIGSGTSHLVFLLNMIMSAMLHFLPLYQVSLFRDLVASYPFHFETKTMFVFNPAYFCSRVHVLISSPRLRDAAWARRELETVRCIDVASS